MAHTTTPTIRDLVKAASQGVADGLQSRGSPSQDKTASPAPAEDYSMKLASTCIVVGQALAKQASEDGNQGGGVSPGVSRSISPTGKIETGHSNAKPGTGQSSTSQTAPGASSATNLETSRAIGNGKTASQGPGALPESNASQPTGQPAGGKPADAAMVSTVDKIRAMTQKQVNAPRERDTAGLISQGMNTGDTTAQNAFTHHGGAKTADDTTVRDLGLLSAIPGAAVGALGGGITHGGKGALAGALLGGTATGLSGAWEARKGRGDKGDPSSIETLYRSPQYLLARHMAQNAHDKTAADAPGKLQALKDGAKAVGGKVKDFVGRLGNARMGDVLEGEGLHSAESIGVRQKALDASKAKFGDKARPLTESEAHLDRMHGAAADKIKKMKTENRAGQVLGIGGLAAATAAGGVGAKKVHEHLSNKEASALTDHDLSIKTASAEELLRKLKEQASA